MSTAIYPKLLEGNNQSFIQNNITHLFFIGILLTTITISFGKSALFILNPIYVDAYPIVIILSIIGFFTVLRNLFKQMLTAIETVDLNEKSTKNDYFQSKLFSVHTVQNISSVIIVISLVLGLVFLINTDASELNYLEYWASVVLVVEISLTFYLYLHIKRNFSFKFETNSILKYILISSLVFGPLYYISELFLSYNSNIFNFVGILLVIIIMGVATYLSITYFTDNRSRELITSIIGELKNKQK
jgi:uncharacterized integral membrane protein